MSVTAVIQARMGSQRMPGKVLEDLCGQPLIYRVIERVRAASNIHQVVLATTENAQDDPLAQACKAWQVPCFRGAAADVLKRYADCARHLALEEVVRICADNPLLDPEALDAAVTRFLAEDADLVDVEGLPIGVGECQVVHKRLLDDLDSRVTDPYDREHVLSCVYLHTDRYRIAHVRFSGEYPPGVRLTVDTLDDLELVRRIYEALQDETFLKNDRVARFLMAHPQLLEMNHHVVQRSRVAPTVQR